MVLNIFYFYGIIYILCQLHDAFFKDGTRYNKELQEMAHIPDVNDLNDTIDQYKKIREIDNHYERKNPINTIFYYVNMAWVTLGFFTNDWRLFICLLIFATVPSIIVGICMMKKINNEVITGVAKYTGIVAKILAASLILYYHFSFFSVN